MADSQSTLAAKIADPTPIIANSNAVAAFAQGRIEAEIAHV